MSRARRGRNKAESNFQLRVRKSDNDFNNNERMLNWIEMYRDRKATGTPFKAQNNFQLRVRKSAGPQLQQQQQQQPETGGMRVRKALLQEIRDRRRSVADHSNNNFQVSMKQAKWVFEHVFYFDLDHSNNSFQVLMKHTNWVFELVFIT